MMKLSTLWRFDRTIRPDGTSPVADTIAAHWRHDGDPVRFYRSSANHICTLTVDGQPAFLRFASASERTHEVIARELAIIDHVRASGVPVVRAIPSVHGRLVEQVGTDIGRYHAVLFAGIPGTLKDPEQIPPGEMTAWGATIGRLHTALATAPESPIRKPPAWEVVIAAGLAGPPAVRAEAMRLQQVLSSLPRDASVYGLLHNDPELDNLVWHDEVATVLDFDEYSDGWYLHDIAKALDEILVDGETIEGERGQAFLAGYRSERVLDEAMLTWLPDFAALTRLHGWSLVTSSRDITLDDVEADWMKALIGRFEQGQRDYEAALPSRQ